MPYFCPSFKAELSGLQEILKVPETGASCVLYKTPKMAMECYEVSI